MCPPFTALRSIQTLIDADRMPFVLGAQNCHWEDRARSPARSARRCWPGWTCRYVIAGHSERRQLFADTDEVVNRKVHAVLRNAMTPILCVGETLEEREGGRGRGRGATGSCAAALEA